jgi:hypothetical protein
MAGYKLTEVFVALNDGLDGCVYQISGSFYNIPEEIPTTSFLK